MIKRFCYLVPLLLVAVAAARDKPEDWIEVRSAHFVVVSNASEKQARNVADEFERMRAVFLKAFPRVQAESGAPITVVAVKNEKDFRALEPEVYLAKGQLKLGGLFLHAADNNFVLMRLDVGSEHPYATIYHEYTHYLTRRAEEWIPLWLKEGLAEFYENTEIRDKGAVLGKPSGQNLYFLRQNRLLPLTTLFTIDPSSPYYHEENKGSIFYAESWCLTHYLTIKDFQEKTTRVSDYMELVRQKVDPVTAATRAFGDLNALQAALEKYVRQSSYHFFQLAGPVAVDTAELKVRALTPSQADAVRAEFLAYSGRFADARTLAEGVLREDPNNVSAHETMGYAEFRQGHLAEARNWYEKAVKLDSQSSLAHYYFASIAMTEGHLGSGDDARVESSLRTAIKLNPSFAPAYDRLAVFFGMRHENLEEAYRMALRAVSIDPSNVGYRLNAANILMESRRGKDALRVLSEALKVAKSPQDIALVQNSLHVAEQYEAAQEAFEHQTHELSQPGPGTQSVAEGAAGQHADTSPAEGHPAAFAVSGARRTVAGTITEVQCSSPAKMDVKLEARDGILVLHTDNYYTVRFSAAGFIPTGELRPCSDLQGKHVRVEFVESSGKTPAGQITSVEVGK